MDISDLISYLGIGFFALFYGWMLISFIIDKIRNYRNPGIQKTKEFRKWERRRKLKSKFAFVMFIVTILAPAMLIYIFLLQLGVTEIVSTLVMLGVIGITAFYQTQLIGYKNNKNSFFNEIDL